MPLVPLVVFVIQEDVDQDEDDSHGVFVVLPDSVLGFG